MQSKPMRFHLCFISVLYVHETRLLIAVLAIALPDGLKVLTSNLNPVYTPYFLFVFGTPRNSGFD